MDPESEAAGWDACPCNAANGTTTARTAATARPTKAPAQPVAVAACVEQCAHTLLQVRSCRHAEGRGVSARMRHGPRQAYQVLRVCGLLRSRSHHRVVARALLFAAEARGRQPRQRMKPIQC